MATLYAKAAGGNWSAAATWSNVSSAGTDNSGPPAATDDVVFDTGSNGTVTVDSATLCLAKTVTCQAAANIITFTATKKLTVSGSVTFYTGMTISGTGNLTLNAAGTLTSAGITSSIDTLTISAATTLNTSGTTWNNITITNVAITLDSGLSCSGNLSFTAAASNLTFLGAYNISCVSLIWDAYATSTIVLVAGQTLTVTTNLYLCGNPNYLTTMKSATASSATNLTYQGTAANCKVFAITFTDVDASTSAQGIDNWQGGTLTRTTNITNRTSADLATAANAAKIISDTTISGVTGTYHEATEAEVQSGVTFGALSALTGSYAGGGGGGGSNRVICGIG